MCSSSAFFLWIDLGASSLHLSQAGGWGGYIEPLSVSFAPDMSQRRVSRQFNGTSLQVSVFGAIPQRHEDESSGSSSFICLRWMTVTDRLFISDLLKLAGSQIPCSGANSVSCLDRTSTTKISAGLSRSDQRGRCRTEHLRKPPILPFRDASSPDYSVIRDGIC